jgi:hypothetical protein
MKNVRALTLALCLALAFLAALAARLRGPRADPFSLELEAERALLTGDLSRAARLYGHAARAGGGFSPRHRLALLHLRAGAPDVALFRAALAAAPPEVDRDLYARAVAWLEEGRLDLALAALRESTEALDFSP